ncbi:hypothetical protein EB169_00360 [archaeon]|nr:hypothetical protein [archaeon]
MTLQQIHQQHFLHDITEGGTLDTILSNGTIYFGSDTTYPPFESLDDNGNVVGFDADIAAAIAEKFSAAYDTTITAVMQTNDWDPIIPDLQSGKFDAILSAMTKTAERDQVIDFTRAYYTSSQGILANADSPSITGIADLNSSEITIAVQSGTTSQLYAVDNLQAATLNVFDISTQLKMQQMDFQSLETLKKKILELELEKILVSQNLTVCYQSQHWLSSLLC